MILRLAGGGEVESRAFALTDMVRWGYNGLRNAPGNGSPIGDAQAVPAINRAARMRAEAVASLRLGYWRGSGPSRTQVMNTPQARFVAQNRYNEFQTRFDFWECVEESLAYRGNGYVWKLVDPATQRLVSWFALHPDQVTPLGGGQYRVDAGGDYIDPVGAGKKTYSPLGADVILHFRGHGDGGTETAPSPVQVFREALTSPLARIRHENRMWKRGTALQQAVSFPADVTPTQAEQWKGQFSAQYAGSDGDTTMVLGGGATLTPIGMSLADALYVDMAHLTREDASMIMGVPANLLGAQLQRAVPNLEQDLATWLRFGLGPEVMRLEATLAADVHVTPPNSQADPMFDTDEFVRGDLITEANILHQRIQDGTLTPDEARAIIGYPPHLDGLGATPQITPVGGGANPPIPAAFDPEPDD